MECLWNAYDLETLNGFSANFLERVCGEFANVKRTFRTQRSMNTHKTVYSMFIKMFKIFKLSRFLDFQIFKISGSNFQIANIFKFLRFQNSQILKIFKISRFSGLNFRDFKILNFSTSTERSAVFAKTLSELVKNATRMNVLKMFYQLFQKYYLKVVYIQFVSSDHSVSFMLSERFRYVSYPALLYLLYELL